MVKRAHLKSLIPEFFLVASVLYYWMLTSNLFNPFALGLLALLTFQIVCKKTTLGLVISTVVILLTLYMVLALISELSEFETANQDFNNLWIFGALYLGITLIMASAMFLKYLKQKIK